MMEETVQISLAEFDRLRGKNKQEIEELQEQIIALKEQNTELKEEKFVKLFVQKRNSSAGRGGDNEWLELHYRRWPSELLKKELEEIKNSTSYSSQSDILAHIDGMVESQFLWFSNRIHDEAVTLEEELSKIKQTFRYKLLF